jgi:hypothetical protein
MPNAEISMAKAITRAELALEIGKLGATASGWIHEVIGPRAEWDRPAPAEMVAAVVTAFRERLDTIEARADLTTSITPRT